MEDVLQHPDQGKTVDCYLKNAKLLGQSDLVAVTSVLT
jgi:hypothetical protein